MKISLFLSSLWLFLATFFSPISTTILSGTIQDNTGEALIGATIKVSKGSEFVRGAITDLNGQYRIQLDPGTYDVAFSFTGYQSQKIENVRVRAGEITVQNLVMSNSNVLDEVKIVPYKVPLIENDQTSSGQTLTSDQIKNLPTRSVETTVATQVGASSIDGSAVDVRGKRAESTDYYIDGVKVAGAPPAPAPTLTDGGMAKAKVMHEAALYDAITRGDDEVAPAKSGRPTQPAPRAGLLTAGEWNDLHNWNRHWLDLLADGETDAYQNQYGFFPKQRYTVMLTNEQDFPITDARVQLRAAGNILWEARTDNMGKAELWVALFQPEAVTETLEAIVTYQGSNDVIKNLKSAKDGFNYLKINALCETPQNVDILWAVDATGSMGDEIEYLKTELLDVIQRAKNHNPALSYQMGAVFYRDKGDEYVTRSNAFSADMTQTVGFIQKQRASGGGDYPEAVHSALEEAIFTQKWSENAVARICFLVLDASPHSSEAVKASLQKSIREAARLGIRIVPIAASGVQKDTEFLMKFFGLATNGTYVFLTDHSGIGGKHLAPTTDEYKVEPFNQLLVRIITEYSTVESCEGKTEIRFEADPQQQPGPTVQALYYPNPAVDQFTLELPFVVQSVTIYDSEGKAVRKLESPLAGPNMIQIQDLTAGFYTIRILNNGVMQSGKLMVVRS